MTYVPDLDHIATVAEADALIDRLVEQDWDDDTIGTVWEHRDYLEFQEKREPVKKAPPAASADPLADIHLQIATAEAEVAALPANQSFGKRLEVAELRKRAELLEARLPFVGMSNEDIEKQARESMIRYEELEREAKDWDKSSEKHKDLAEQMEAASLGAIRAKHEIEIRQTLDSARKAKMTLAYDEAKRLATEEHRREWTERLVELTGSANPDMARSIFLAPPGAGNDWKPPARSHVEYAKEQRDGEPSAELLQKHLKTTVAEAEAELAKYGAS